MSLLVLTIAPVPSNGLISSRGEITQFPSVLVRLAGRKSAAIDEHLSAAMRCIAILQIRQSSVANEDDDMSS